MRYAARVPLKDCTPEDRALIALLLLDDDDGAEWADLVDDPEAFWAIVERGEREGDITIEVTEAELVVTFRLESGGADVRRFPRE